MLSTSCFKNFTWWQYTTFGLLTSYSHLFGPTAALLLKSAISRKRESLADATGVAFTRNPAGLRSALEVLERDSTVVHQKSKSIAHIWIESPLDAKAVSKMFSTHPPIAERIAVLKAMESLN